MRPSSESKERKKAASKAATLKLERVKLADLKPHKSNPRTHPEPGTPAWAALKRSLEADYFEPLVVNSGRKVKSLRNVIVSGHLRVKVMRAEGYTHADAVIVDYSEQRHVEVMLRANNHTGEWDEAALAALLKDIPEADLDLTGFDGAEIDRLLATLDGDGNAPEPQLDRAEELRKKWGTKRGQLWEIGTHRLLCGDSTVKADVESVMRGEKSELSFTSPPYMDARKYRENGCATPYHLAEFIPASAGYCNLFAVNLGLLWKDSELNTFWDDYTKQARHAGLKLLAWNIWNRDEAGTIGQATAMFPVFHEFIFIFGKKRIAINRTQKNKTSGTRAGLNRREQDGVVRRTNGPALVQEYGRLPSVVTLKPHKGLSDHPAVFPVQLPALYIEACTERGGTVFDPFCGSGTTLVACEQLKRRGRGIEIDPGYVAVALDRLSRMGLNPKLKRDDRE